MQTQKDQKSNCPITTNFLDNPVIRRYVLSGGVMMDAADDAHISKFKRILEFSMSQGRWNGNFPRIS